MPRANNARVNSPMEPRMLNRWIWTVAATLALVALAPCAAPARTGDAPAGDQAEPKQADAGGWIRLRRSKGEPRELRLQVATREYLPAGGGPGPRLELVSAVHIADKAFYDDLQKKLDATDLVLFEGVGPPGLGTEKLRRSAAKAERTKHRLTLVGELLEGARKKAGRYPASLDDLAAAVAPGRTKAHWLSIARRDGWDRELAYRPAADGSAYELFSLGADGEEGGTGKNADLALDRSELGRWKEEGLQKKLADAFGLTFQSDGISTDGANWRNSDLSMDEVSRRLGGDPNATADDAELAPASPTILDMLNPDSSMAKVASMVLGLIRMMPGGADRGKLMMMLILPHAEETLGAMGGGGPLGGVFDLARTMKVIIDDRNQKVTDDLKEIITSWRDERGAGAATPAEAAPAARRTIAVFYGGGHMPDLEKRLAEQLGYTRAGERWSTAIRLDLGKAGITDEELRSLNRMMREQMEMVKGMGR